MIQTEEAFWAGNKGAEGVLKDLITGEHLGLERKGVDVVQVHNHANFFITSNEGWVIPATWDERRFAVFEIGDERLGDRDYFAQIDRESPEAAPRACRTAFERHVGARIDRETGDVPG